ncbi:MAG: outer membrane beta-barrel protein [Bacteroidia bacterium]
MKRAFAFLSLMVLTLQCQSQFFQSIGVNGGLTMAREIWKVDNTSPSPYYFNDPQKWKYSWNAAVTFEFINSEIWRWDSEIQYNNKGGIDVDKTHNNKKLGINPTHLCWNNYLKYRFDAYQGVPYVFAGPRLEYVLQSSSNSPPVQRGNFNKIQITPAVGAGWEFITYGIVKPFIEAIYNPDPTFMIPSYHVLDLKLYNQAIELRAGIRIEIRSGKETCPRALI